MERMKILLSRRAALSASIALIAIAFQACGGGAPDEPTRVPLSDLTGGADVTATVEVRGFEFVPDVMHVRAGVRVVWENADGVAHTATSEGAWDTGTIAAGGEGSQLFEQIGQFNYICSIHPAMTGRIVVEP